MPFNQSEPVSDAIRDHQSSLTDWPYAELVGELHRWVEIFDFEFKLNLPSYPVLKFMPLRRAGYASYAWFRSELGTRDNITFNTKYLNREPGLILRTLCHELLHLWQHYYGNPSPSNYHNKEYRSKALSCGLYVDAWGCTGGHSENFTSVLRKYGVQLDTMMIVLIQLHGEMLDKGLLTISTQKMTKWRCQCTTVRCATKLAAECLKCKSQFYRV